MQTDLLACPGCRTRTAERIDVRTLERRGEVLACACGRRYPIVDGVPIVLADPAAFLRGEATAIVERELDPEVAALLVEHGPDDAAYPRLLEHLSTYLDAHWGDRATPPLDEPAASGARALAAKIAARAAARVEHAVELGCSAGRFVAELAAGADHVIGLDLQFAAVRRARRLLDGEPLAYARRVAGRHYAPARIAAGPPVRCTLVCGDALDPPLIPRMFGRVVALNLLDSVASPRQLLSVLDGLCARGGELILASPYSWSSAVMAEPERLGAADPAAEVAEILRAGEGLEQPYELEDEANLAWTLRRDARSTVAYRTHYLRARKR